MQPNYEAAATAALNLLIENHTTETPIDSLSILLSRPGVRVMTFSEMASEAGEARDTGFPGEVTVKGRLGRSHCEDHISVNT